MQVRRFWIDIVLALDNNSVLRYYEGIMIKSFACKETEKLFRGEFTRKLPQTIHRSVLRKLLILDAAEMLEDLRVPPGNRLERLSGDREGQYSIRVNNQWRVCFEWRRENAYNVEVVDYH